MAEVAFPAGGGRQDSALLFGLLQATGEDNLRINSWSSFSDVPIELTTRFRKLNGELQVSVHNTKTDGLPYTKASTLVPLGNGHLLNARIGIPSTLIAAKRGDVFVQVELVRGLTGAIVPVGTLIQGYIAREASLAWPGNALQGPHEGPGRPIVIRPANPSFGANLVYSVPAGVRWRLMAILCALTTDATVQDRLPFVRLLKGSEIVCDSAAAQTQPASVTKAYSWAAGQDGLRPSGATLQGGGLPANSILEEDDQITIQVVALAGGDSIILPAIWAEQWLDP